MSYYMKNLRTKPAHTKHSTSDGYYLLAVIHPQLSAHRALPQGGLLQFPQRMSEPPVIHNFLPFHIYRTCLNL